MLSFLRPTPAFVIQGTDVKSVSKLLMNSWSAEYALRIPAQSDDPKSVSWSFPQTYYAPMFSAKALLLVSGNATSNELAIRDGMRRFYSAGYYQPNFPAVRNPFEEVYPFRLTAKPREPKPDDIEAYRLGLVEQVEQMARCHEREIMKTIGALAYRQLVEQAPEYLREAFLADRTSILLCEISSRKEVVTA